MDMPVRYTIPEAAALLKISRATIDRRIAAGQLAAIRDGGRVFIDSDELARYAREGTHGQVA